MRIALDFVRPLKVLPLMALKTGFDPLDFGHLNLPFDLTQGGELIEPFRASDFK